MPPRIRAYFAGEISERVSSEEAQWVLHAAGSCVLLDANKSCRTVSFRPNKK